jgi:hypothetical protein
MIQVGHRIADRESESVSCLDTYKTRLQSHSNWFDGGDHAFFGRNSGNIILPELEWSRIPDAHLHQFRHLLSKCGRSSGFLCYLLWK